MSTPLLSIRNLSVAFGKQGPKVIDNLSLDIHPGECVGLAGESGAGKSLTGLSILGLLPSGAHYQQGDILFDGKALLRQPPAVMRALRGGNIVMIFQEPLSALNPLHRVGKQIDEMLVLHRPMTPASRQTHVAQLLQQVGLSPHARYAQSFPHELSGGQRQRLLIAMALAVEPQLIIADEPTTALDVTVQTQIMTLLQKIQKEKNSAMLLISHNLAMLARYTTRIGVMRAGQLLEFGKTSQLFAKPKHTWTRHLLAATRSSHKRLRMPKSETDLLRVQNLSVRFDIGQGMLAGPKQTITAVQNVSFSLSAGITLGVVGESGSGKTSIARALLQLIPSHGDIVFAGQNLRTLSKRALRQSRAQMQMVFQDPFSSLSPRLSIDSILREGLDIHASTISQEEKRKRIIASLDAVELPRTSLERYPHEFSGGQRQRIALARALVLRPKLVILDEPSSSLDRSVEAQLTDLLRRLQMDYQLAYIFITHNLELVRLLAHKTLVLRRGAVVEAGPTAQLFRAPQHPYAKTLVKAARAFVIPKATARANKSGA